MKIIEAMKKVKMNEVKIVDLQTRIGGHCANLSHETPVYGTETGKRIMEWLQSCTDLTQDNVQLLCAIQRTNLATPVTIEIDGKQVTKSIAAWVWRRRTYATIDMETWRRLTDRNLREGQINVSTGVPIDVKIIRHFDPFMRDTRISMYRDEPALIDSTLEVVNAVTDLLEVA